MSLNPNRLSFMRQSLYIPVSNFQTFVADDGVANGVPVLLEWGTSGVTGVSIAVAADQVSHILAVPTEIDRNQDIRFYVAWVSGAVAVADRTALWKVTYTPFTAGTTVLAASGTALDTILVADAPAGTAGTIEETAAGILNGGTLGDGVTSLLINVILEEMVSTETNWTDFTTEKISLLGLRVEYTPRYGRGNQSEASSWTAD